MDFKLKDYIKEPVSLPKDLLASFAESPACAPYLVSCFEKGRVLFLSPQFETITGYACEKFKTEGLQFWFSVIHPADVQAVANAITKAQHELAGANERPLEPLRLEYRVKRSDGRIVWLRELKQIVSYRDGKKDHILGCLQDITTEKAAEASSVRKILAQEPEINGLLQVAVGYQLPGGNPGESDIATRISAREKEVLRLVAGGSSSKQIAAELGISENTVETHRRHLLEKFKVQNSTALVKEAHRLCLV